MAVKIANRLLRYGRSDISGVTYTREELEKMVEGWKSKDTPVFGVIPDGITPESYIDLSRVATKITNMWLDDEGLVVEQEVLATPMGDVFRSLVDASVTSDIQTFSLSPNMVGILDNGYNAIDLKFNGVLIRGPNTPAIPG